MKRKTPAIFLILLLSMEVFACGKKANPVAPEDTVPAPVSDLRAWAKAEGIFLEWSLPAKNADGSRLEGLLGFRVFRQERSPTGSSCPECPLKFDPIAEIDVDYPRGAQIEGGKVLWRDAAVKVKHQYIYFVLAYNIHKSASPESNQVKIFWDNPPVAPVNVQVHSEDRALEISWESSPLLSSGQGMKDLTGFNIYRRTEEGTFGFFPLNAQPIPGTQYVDGVLENGKRYTYQVRQVRNFRGTPIEGLGSAPASGIPEKKTPPSPPTGVVAVRQKEGVALRWNTNPETDIAGYNLYRREGEEREWPRVNPHLITEPYFLDTTVEPQKSYEYRLKAVDSSGKESDFSQPVEVGLNS